MITLVDYGMGNVSSVRNAFKYLGVKSDLTNNRERILNAEKLVLPGVGAFPKAMNRLNELDLIPVLKEAVLDRLIPCLGVCLGMQLLSESSEEHGLTDGLGFIAGSVKSLGSTASISRIPHVGFNSVESRTDSQLFEGIESGSDFYFVHSFFFDTKKAENQAAVTNCDGVEITAAVQCDHIFGVQFHPEKSQSNGLALLKNFLKF